MTSLGASLLVALTTTPVLCMVLLGRSDGAAAHREGWRVRFRKARDRSVVAAALYIPVSIGLASLARAAAAVVVLASFGRSFLPEFIGGSRNIAAATAPRTPLGDTDEIVGRLETPRERRAREPRPQDLRRRPRSAPRASARG
ncbi:hypothetical protein [Sorangium sp. So ce1151]|uniref:hypothetical protein n=1 Tax=Sorangium sp. So ce1151 TaxID=3133332 RepID=UPI003F63024A